MQTKCVILRQNAADVRSQELSHRPSQMTTGLATATTKMTPSASVFTENVVEHSNWHLNDLSEGLFMSPALSALADDHPADATEPFVPFSMFDHSLSNRRNGPAQRVYTDIPVLDDLFSELNSDAPFDCSDETRVTAPSFDLADSFTAKSEPIDLADMERIMFPVHDRPTRKSIRNSLVGSCMLLLTLSTLHLGALHVLSVNRTPAVFIASGLDPRLLACESHTTARAAARIRHDSVFAVGHEHGSRKRSAL